MASSTLAPKRSPSITARPTPGISCEAVPASVLAGAGMRRHLRLSAACGARVGADSSFVSFIPLFDRTSIEKLKYACDDVEPLTMVITLELQPPCDPLAIPDSVARQ